MFIETESTPNPDVLKFLPDRQVMEDGTLEVTSLEEAEKYSHLAMRLMTVTGVKQVFLAKDYVSVTKEDDWDWNVLKPLVMTGVMQHLTTNGPIVSDDYKRLKEKAAGPQKERSSEENEIIDQIKALLDERVRPAVAQDGGDIEFEDFDNGVLYLRMRGACAGCPSSSMTLKAGIENMMKHYVPEVMEVRAADAL